MRRGGAPPSLSPAPGAHQGAFQIEPGLGVGLRRQPPVDLQPQHRRRRQRFPQGVEMAHGFGQIVQYLVKAHDAQPVRQREDFFLALVDLQAFPVGGGAVADAILFVLLQKLQRLPNPAPASAAAAIPIYIRVSSDDQVRGTSLETQLKDCRAACIRAGYTPGEVFADPGESAKSIENRKAFLGLLDHVKRHRSPAIMVWKIDRLARNNLDAQIVRSRLAAQKCQVMSATEPISNDPSGKFMFDILSAVAEYDNQLRAERCRLGMTAQVKDGWWVHSAPVGYLTARSPEGKPTLVPDPKSRHFVTEAFKLAAAGIAQTEIAKRLNPRGFVTRAGNPMNKTSLSSLLRNPAYCGEMRDSLTGDVVIQGRWEPLTDKDTWLKAQVNSRVDRMARLPKDEFIYKPFLVCGRCGANITASYSRGHVGRKHGYYHCPKCGCRATVAEVEELIARRIEGLSMSKRNVRVLRRLVQDTMAKDYDRRGATRASAQRRLTLLHDQMDRLVNIYTEGHLTRNLFISRKTDLEWKMLAARAELESADNAKLDLMREFLRAEEFLLHPGNFWKTATTRERCLTLPLFFPGKLKLHAIKRVGTLRLEGSNCPIWHPHRESNPGRQLEKLVS